MRLLVLFALIAVFFVGCGASADKPTAKAPCGAPVKGESPAAMKQLLKREACLVGLQPTIAQLEDECQPRAAKSPRKIVISQPAPKQLLVKWEKPETPSGLVSYTVMIFPEKRIEYNNKWTVPAGTEEYLFAGAELKNPIKYNTTYNAYMIATYGSCTTETAIQEKQFITPVNGDILWTGDGSEELYKQWNSSSSSLPPGCLALNKADNTATTTASSLIKYENETAFTKTAAHKGAIRFHVAEGESWPCDPGGNGFEARAEIGQGNPPNTETGNKARFDHPEDTHWTAFEVAMKTNIIENGGLSVQWRQSPDSCPPPEGIGLVAKKLVFNYYLNLPAPGSCGSKSSPEISGVLAAEKWYKVVVKIVFSEVPSGPECPGEVQVWVDGVEKLHTEHIRTMKPGNNGAKILAQRIGEYPGGETSVAHTLDDWFAGYVVAKTRAAAEEYAFTAP